MREQIENIDDEYVKGVKILTKEMEAIKIQMKDIDNERTQDVHEFKIKEKKRVKQIKELENQCALLTGQAQES